MAKASCALCGTQLGLFAKVELTCCGETQTLCPTCGEQLKDLNHFERARILLDRGRPANPQKMRPILEQYDKEQADKKIKAAEAEANAYSELTCLRCGIPLRNLGRRWFPAYTTSMVNYRYSDWNSLELFLLRCDKCGHTEFISNDTILKAFAPEVDLIGEMVECTVCGVRYAAGGGCPRCAVNNANDRVSKVAQAANAKKKSAPGEKPPWER